MKTKKNKKHLDFYYKCMETGRLPGGDGLCKEALLGRISESLLSKIDPMNLCWQYRSNNYEELFGDICLPYWGSDDSLWRRGQFTPLRQTIVLLMAAMNNEL